MANVTPRLHHCSQSVRIGSLELVLEMYQHLGCDVVFRPQNGYAWAMIGQPGLKFFPQIVEVTGQPISDLETKRRSHIAFLSDDPEGTISKVEKWAQAKNVRFVSGGWTDKERYFDLPDIFVDSVIEIMHSSIDPE